VTNHDNAVGYEQSESFLKFDPNGNGPPVLIAVRSRECTLSPICGHPVCVHTATMNTEQDEYGFFVDPAERMQQAMLGFFDLKDELELAGFPADLQYAYEELRVRFVDEFERRHPGYGKGRAVWR